MKQKIQKKDKRTTNKTANKSQTRGIMFYSVKRAKPFVMQWIIDGKRKNKSFATEVERQRFADDLIQTKKELGTQNEFNPTEWAEYLNFRNKVGRSVTLDEIAQCWLTYGSQTTQESLPNAIESFLNRKIKDGIDSDTTRHYRKNLSRLNEFFPDVMVNEVLPNKLQKWLDSMHPKFSKETIYSHRKDARTLFNYCIQQGWIQQNPILKTAKIKIIRDTPQILTPEEVQKLMTTNKDLPIIGRLALEAFAGLRASSAQRITESEINFEDKGIELPATKIKTGKRIYLSGFPDTLWQWLKMTPEECWKMKPKQIETEKSKAFIRAGIPHPKNCLRHSFCTYHLTAFGDIGKSITLSCHSSIKIFNEHYRGLSTVADAKKFWEILP